MSHLGRPKGSPDEKYSLMPVAKRLAVLLDKDIVFAKSNEVVDDKVLERATMLKPGEMMLIENVRFREEETKNKDEFSKQLAKLGDIFVNDVRAPVADPVVGRGRVRGTGQGLRG